MYSGKVPLYNPLYSKLQETYIFVRNQSTFSFLFIYYPSWK